MSAWDCSPSSFCNACASTLPRAGRAQHLSTSQAVTCVVALACKPDSPGSHLATTGMPLMQRILAGGRACQLVFTLFGSRRRRGAAMAVSADDKVAQPRRADARLGCQYPRAIRQPTSPQSRGHVRADGPSATSRHGGLAQGWAPGRSGPRWLSSAPNGPRLGRRGRRSRRRRVVRPVQPDPRGWSLLNCTTGRERERMWRCRSAREGQMSPTSRAESGRRQVAGAAPLAGWTARMGSHVGGSDGAWRPDAAQPCRWQPGKVVGPMGRSQRVLAVLVAGLTVLALAGCSSSKSEDTGGGGQSGGVTVTTAASGGPTIVNVEGGEKPDGTYYFTVTPMSVKAGPTNITFKNAGTKEHEVVVLKTDTPADKLKVGANHAVSEAASVGEDSETKPGKTKSTTIDLQPGTYVLVCNIERHYEKGMYAALTVT